MSHLFGTLFLVLASLIVHDGYAASLDIGDFQAAAELAVDSATRAIVKTVGFGGDYRTFQGVRGPSGIFGLDVGVSVMASQVPQEFIDALGRAGYKKPPFAAIPAPHLRASKRLADFCSIDAGYAKYKEFKLWGAGVQFFTDNDEGPDFALRLSYAENFLGMVATRTFSPSLMVGKRLSFFEPYLGVGYQATGGKIAIPLSYQGIDGTITARKSITATNLYSGLVLNLFPLQIAFEGNYSFAGISGIGAKAGLRF